LKINQSINFVDPFNKEIHTNNIERAWRSLKEYMPTSLKGSGYDEYVKSFLFNKELQKKAELDELEFVVVMTMKFFHY
jgi:phenylalanyl-tRNA synthetase beta subunit